MAYEILLQHDSSMRSSGELTVLFADVPLPLEAATVQQERVSCGQVGTALTRKVGKVSAGNRPAVENGPLNDPPTRLYGMHSFERLSLPLQNSLSLQSG